MTKLSDTQLMILSAAANREGNSALPLPASLRGGAAKKVVGALLTKSYLAEGQGPGAADDTKQAKLIEMLRAKDGASIDEIVAATGWQPHTVRGAIAGALKKKLGLAVTSEKVAGRDRVYKIGV